MHCSVFWTKDLGANTSFGPSKFCPTVCWGGVGGSEARYHWLFVILFLPFASPCTFYVPSPLHCDMFPSVFQGDFHWGLLLLRPTSDLGFYHSLNWNT